VWLGLSRPIFHEGRRFLSFDWGAWSFGGHSVWSGRRDLFNCQRRGSGTRAYERAAVTLANVLTPQSPRHCSRCFWGLICAERTGRGPVASGEAAPAPHMLENIRRVCTPHGGRTKGTFKAHKSQGVCLHLGLRRDRGPAPSFAHGKLQCRRASAPCEQGLCSKVGQGFWSFCEQSVHNFYA
jgi:hypothetical protein